MAKHARIDTNDAESRFLDDSATFNEEDLTQDQDQDAAFISDNAQHAIDVYSSDDDFYADDQADDVIEVATVSPHVAAAKKRRRKLVLIIIVLILAVGALAGVGYFVFQNTQADAAKTAQSTSSTELSGASKDANTAASATVSVPDITKYIETDLETVIAGIGHGAVKTNEYTINEDGVNYHVEQTLELQDDSSDDKFGVPQVYLSYGWHDELLRVGYCATTSQLGYGVASFEDMVSNLHAIDKTLQAAGISVEDGTCTLPSSKSEYQKYDSDNKLTREYYDWTGRFKASNGQNYTWEAALMYDYTTANATGNLSDTLRQIYVYCLEY